MAGQEKVSVKDKKWRRERKKKENKSRNEDK